jgi:hypothetical protein
MTSRAGWLCSDDASFVLGHALAVDGGYVVPWPLVRARAPG